MDFDLDPVRIIEEKKLVGTLITGAPNPRGFKAALFTVIFMGLTSMFYWGNFFESAHLMPAVRRLVFEDWQWWRVFTAIFIHGDFGHYLSNMYMLGIFSFFIFGYFGSDVYPWKALFLAGVVNGFAILTYPPDVRLLGASGLVYLLGGFWLAIYGLIQRQYSVASRIVRAVGMGLMVFFPTSFVENTSYRTHAIGIVVGFVAGVIYFFLNREKIRSFERYKVSYVEDLPTSH